MAWILTTAWNSDTPFSLAASVLEAIPVLTGTQDTGFAWTIYTGDLVSHDTENQLSRRVLFFRGLVFVLTGRGSGIMSRTRR